MSFAFAFGGDDIEDDGNTDELAVAIEQCSIRDDITLATPQAHTFQELSTSFPSQISYNILRIPVRTSGEIVKNITSPFSVPRRSVFDIRTQLMVEANPEDKANDNLLAGLENGDLSSGVYEGGFKTWECSLDLASLVANMAMDEDMHVIELGAGSAIPSLVLLQRALQKSSVSRTRFTLCDYNADVLRLGTAPNTFLAHQLLNTGVSDADQEDGEIDDLDETNISEAMKFFETKLVSLKFISGAWGERFLSILGDSSKDEQEFTTTLILASETIYSPSSTKTFAETLVQLLRSTRGKCKAWVAAKQVYFGVGGGVEAFKHEIASRGGNLRTILEVKDAGVARVVLEVWTDQSTDHGKSE